jgi:hypothetical protein
MTNLLLPGEKGEDENCSKGTFAANRTESIRTQVAAAGFLVAAAIRIIANMIYFAFPLKEAPSGAARWYSLGTAFFQFAGVSAAILIRRALTCSYIHRAIQSGAIEARRAVLVGDTNANNDVLRFGLGGAV